MAPFGVPFFVDGKDIIQTQGQAAHEDTMELTRNRTVWAEKYTGNNIAELKAFCPDLRGPFGGDCYLDARVENVMRVGDWLVHDPMSTPQWEIFSPDVFAQTFFANLQPPQEIAKSLVDYLNNQSFHDMTFPTRAVMEVLNGWLGHLGAPKITAGHSTTKPRFVATHTFTVAGIEFATPTPLSEQEMTTLHATVPALVHEGSPQPLLAVNYAMAVVSKPSGCRFTLVALPGLPFDCQNDLIKTIMNSWSTFLPELLALGYTPMVSGDPIQ